MAAAAQRERRASSRSRTRDAADRVRARPARPSTVAGSKLQAARAVGLSPPVAALGAAALAALIVVAALATDGRAAKLLAASRTIAGQGADLARSATGSVKDRFSILALPAGPVVGAVRLEGASPAARDEILRAVAVAPGQDMFGLDLNAVRARVEAVGWVERARIIRLFPDTLVVSITQRPLMAVWEHEGRRDVVTTDGHVVGGIDPAHFRALPRIIGPGANLEAGGLLKSVLARPRLAARLTAIRRVDERRWDLILKNGCVILLPDVDEGAALDRLDGLDRRAKVLDLRLARLDLRDPAFSVARPLDEAPPPPKTSHGV